MKSWFYIITFLCLIVSALIFTKAESQSSEQARRIFAQLRQSGPLHIPATPLAPNTIRYFTTVPGETARRVHWYDDLLEMGYRFNEINQPTNLPDDTVFVDLSGVKQPSYYKKLKPTQRISSFPSACRTLTDKGKLPPRIRDYYAERGISFPGRDHFLIGETYALQDFFDRTQFFQLHNKTATEWLVKPTQPYSRRGKGIFPYSQSCGHQLAAFPNARPCLDQYKLTDDHIIQKFAANAKSINDHFMTARWVFLIASLEPLRIYSVPLTVITSTSPLKRNAEGVPILDDPETFITNTDYASNLLETRHSFIWFLNDFIQDPALANYISEETEKLILSTLFPYLSELRRSSALLANASFSGHQLIGMDFAFDENWTPKLLEHNCRPDVSLYDLDVCIEVFYQIRRFTLEASGILDASRNFTAELSAVADRVDQAILSSGVSSLDPGLRSHLILSLYEEQQLQPYPRWQKIFPPIHRPHLLPYYRTLFDFSTLDEFFLAEIESNQ